MSLVVGIDPSLVGTAVCALNYDTEQIVYIETFVEAKKYVGIDRLCWLFNKLNATIKDLMAKDTIKEFFIEGFAFMAQGRAVFDVAQLGGIFRLQLAGRWGGYYEIPPTSLKMFVCTKGNAKKEVMLEQTFRKWNLGSDTLKDNNQVDAYGLAKFGIAYLKSLAGKEYAQYEMKAIKGIKEKQRVGG